MGDELQFDRADFASGSGAACAACKAPLTSEYFEANGQVLCPGCAAGLEQLASGTGSSAGRFAKAVLFGLGAAIAGTIAYYGVIAYTNTEWALVSIAIGFLVGKAVRKGSGGRGGWRYQALAAFLTYSSIVWSYVPLQLAAVRAENAADRHGTEQTAGAPVPVLQEAAIPTPSTLTPADPVSDAGSGETRSARSAAGTPGVIDWIVFGGVLLGFAYATPFLAGVSNILGILIIGFGVWQAWRMNQRLELNLTGPHTLAANPRDASGAAPSGIPPSPRA